MEDSKHSKDILGEQYELLQGDVLEKLKGLKDKTFDCIITSPPYNLGISYGDKKISKVNDNKPQEEYLEWIKTVFTECKRVLKDEGSLFLNVGYSNMNPWVAMDVAQQLRGVYQLQNVFTWVKNISVDDKSYGHFKPINSQRFVTPTNESIFHFTKSGKIKLHRLAIGVPYEYKSNLKERKKKKKKELKAGELKPDVRCRGNTWFVRYKTIQNKKERGKHPASFPIELAEMCLKLSFGEETNGIVLDPFLGTGTTLVAAKKLGFRGVGIDIVSEYLEFASKRLESITVPEISSD